MSSNSGANTRASIPSSVRKTIQDIKEIGVNHSDEDVYATLRECNMDPNETVQRLLLMDTFHEVKRKRDKRKENVNGRVYEDSRRKPSNQGWGARSGRGSFSSQYASHDSGFGRNTSVRKENGLDDDREKALKSPALPVLKEVDSRTSTLIEKTPPATVNGHPTGLPKHDVNVGPFVQTSESVDTVLEKDDTDDPITQESTLFQPKVNTEHAPSASDPALVPIQSCDTQLPTAVDAIESQHGSVRSVKIAAEMKDSTINKRHLENSCKLTDLVQIKIQHGSGEVEVSKASSSRSEHSERVNIVLPEINQESPGSKKPSSSPVLPDNASAVNSSLLNAVAPIKAVEELTSKLEKIRFSEGQQVILPNHIQVPDAVKNVLSFGSLDSCFGVGETDMKTSESNRNLNEASEELLEDETAKKPESCDEDTSSSAQDENYPDPPPASVKELIPPPENKVPVPNDDQLKQETLPAVVPPYPVVQTPAYSFGFIPPNAPILGSPLIQVESHDHQHQARLSNSMNENSLAMSTSAPTPPPAHPAGAVQSSVVVSVQPVPLFRQPYPASFIPYAPYLPPFFVPPALQFVGHGGFPPQLPTGNVYMPAPAATSPGMKLSPPLYKPGTNISNQAPVAVPSSAYGVYSPSTAVTSGNSNANEDIVPSVLKENSVYLGQQTEGSTVWIPAPGRDSTNLSLNSFFNLPPQGQHLPVTPQPGHGGFAAAYHPLQTFPASAATHPLLQQAQSMVGPAESMGPPPPPPNAFQQPPQRHQINWNSSF